MSCFSIFAESQIIEIEFKSAGNNNGQKLPTFDDIEKQSTKCIDETKPFDGTYFYTGQYGLRIGQNAQNGTAIINFKEGILDTVTKIELQVSANKNPTNLNISIGNERKTLSTDSKTSTYEVIEFSVTDLKSSITINSKRNSTTTQSFLYLKKITLISESKEPAVPTFSYNGAEVTGAVELYNGDAITVTSKNATSIWINGEENIAENGVVTFTPTKSGTYTFVGKNNEGESEEVSLNITMKEKALGKPVVILNGEPVEDGSKNNVVTYPTTFIVSAEWAEYISIDVECGDKKDSYDCDGDTFSWTPTPTSEQASVTVTAMDENAETTDFAFLLTVKPGELAPVTITDANGTDISEAKYLVEGTEVTIDCATPGAKLTLTSDPEGLEELEVALPYTFTLSRDKADPDGNIAYDGVVELDNYTSKDIPLLYEVIEDPYVTKAADATATFNFTDQTSLTPSNGQVIGSLTSGTGVDISGFVANDITLSATNISNGTDPRIWKTTKGTEYRVYKTSAVSISAPEGFIINKISWEQKDGVIAADQNGTSVITEWVADSENPVNAATVYVTTNAKFSFITVKYTIPAQLKRPKLVVDGEVVENLTELENVAGKELKFQASKGHLLHYQIHGLESTAMRAPVAVQPDAWTAHNSHEWAVTVPDEIPEGGITIHTKAVNGDEESPKRTVYITSTGGVTTGIEGVSAEAAANGNAEWFNLQGVRVANPANGIFIRRQGTKVEKVVLN